MAGELPDIYLQFVRDGDPLIGGSMDYDHPGKEPKDGRKVRDGEPIHGGWIQIKNFSFGFGFETEASKSAKNAALLSGKAPQHPGSKATNKQLQAYYEARDRYDKQRDANAKQRDANNAKSKDKSKEKDKDKQWGHAGAMNFRKCSISKSADPMSKDLISMCNGGTKLKTVTLECCRPAGADKETKMPFFRVIFTDVCLRTCNLVLATEGLPTETFELEYETVQVETWWTDNESGGRLNGTPNRYFFDLNTHEGKEPGEDDDQ